MLQQAVTLGLKAAFRKDRLEVTAMVRNLVPHRVPDGCPWNSYAVLEVTVSDETGWEFETIKRIYTNFGLDKSGQATGVAWKIVKRRRLNGVERGRNPRRETQLSHRAAGREALHDTRKNALSVRAAFAGRLGPGRGRNENGGDHMTLPGQRPS